MDAQVRGRWSFRIVVVAALLLGGAAFFPFWKALLFGAVVASTLDALNQRLIGALRGRRALGAAIMTTAVLLLVLLPVAAMVTLAIKQAFSGVAWVRGVVDERGGVEGLLGGLPGPLGTWAKSALATLPAQDWSENLAGGGKWAAAQLGAIFSASSQALFQMTIALVAIFLLLVDGRRLVAWIVEVSPLGAQVSRELLTELRGVAHAVLISTIATATIQGLLALFGFAVAGVPHAIFFGMVTWFAAFAPGGTAIVSLPLVGVLALTGHPYAAVFLLVWALGVVGLVDNLVKPLIARTGLKLHAGVLFLAFLGGLVTWGMVGVLVGPLAVSFLLAVVRMAARSEPRPPPSAPLAAPTA